jgi:hypothetical protein
MAEALTGTIHKPGGAVPWAGALLKGRCVRFFTDGTFTYPAHEFTVETGTDGAFETSLATPDNGAAEWEFTLPGGELLGPVFVSAGDGPLTLEDLAAGAGSPEQQDTLLTLLQGYLRKDGGVMTGKLTLDGPPTAALHAATMGYVDAAAGGASDIADLTAVGMADGSYVDVLAEGFRERTGAQVLTDIGAEPADADIAKLDVAQSWSAAQNLQDNEVIRPKLKDYGETPNNLGDTGGGTVDIDLEDGNFVSLTVSTSTTALTFSNPPASGTVGSFTMEVTNGGSQTINWPASVAWADGTAPDLTAAGVDILTFYTRDGGTIWYGFAAGLDMSVA